MSRELSLKVYPTPGSDIQDVFSDAFDLARQLELAWVNFRFEDFQATVYPSGCGYLTNAQARVVATWKPDLGITWTEPPQEGLKEA